MAYELVRKLEVYILSEYYNCNLATVKRNYADKNSERRTMVVTSAHCPFDDKYNLPLAKEVLMKECENKRRDLVIGFDANAHHVTSHSSGTIRGEKHLEFLATTQIL